MKHAVMSMNARPTTNPTVITIVLSRLSETGPLCWFDPLFPIGALEPDVVETVVGSVLLGGVVSSCDVVAVVGSTILVVVASGVVVVALTDGVVVGEVVVVASGVVIVTAIYIYIYI